MTKKFTLELTNEELQARMDATGGKYIAEKLKFLAFEPLIETKDYNELWFSPDIISGLNAVKMLDYDFSKSDKYDENPNTYVGTFNKKPVFVIV